MASFPCEWVASEGCGLLLLLPEKHLATWEGSDKPSNGRIVEARFRWNPEGSATDYDRACDVEEFLGVLDVSEGQGVVLGDEPLMTTWLPSATENGGTFVRWVYANDEADLLRLVSVIPDKAYRDADVCLTVEDSDLILFGACEAGCDNVYPRLRVSLPNGRYDFSTAEVSDEHTSAICHRLRKRS